MINIIKDIDLYDHFKEYDVTLIGTNLYCSMGQGVQLKVMLNYPYVFNKNLETKYGDINKLGTVLECTSDNEPTFCLCFITKGYNFRPDLEKDYLSYEALEKCLRLVNVLYKGKRIACPLLGSSRFDGNGDKERILEIFNNCMTDVDVTIYDYFQRSRDEELVEKYMTHKELRKRDLEAFKAIVKKNKEEAEERFRKNGHRRY